MEMLKQKLSSRKFWLGSIAIAIGGACVIVGSRTGDDTLIRTGGTIICAGLAGSVGGEAVVDAARALASKYIETKSTTAAVQSTTSTAKVAEQIASAVAPKDGAQ